MRPSWPAIEFSQVVTIFPYESPMGVVKAYRDTNTGWIK